MGININIKPSEEDEAISLISINQLDKSATELYDMILTSGKRRDPIAPTCAHGCTSGATYLGYTCPTCNTVVETPTFDPKYCVTSETLPFINISILNQIMPQSAANKTTLIEIFCGGRVRQINNELITLLREYEEYSGVNILMTKGNTPKVQAGAVNYHTFLPLYEFMYRKYHGLDKDSELPRHLYVDRYIIPTAVTISSLGGKAKLDTVKDVKRILELAPRTKLAVRDHIKWAGKIVESFYSLLLKIDEDVLSDRNGVYRRYLFGQRVESVFRATLVNLHTIHSYDDAYLPYEQTLTVFEVQIREFLHREGLSPEEVNEQITERKPTEGIIKAMKAIEKSNLSVEIFRNPSQGFYALLTLRVKKINYDRPSDKCLYVSPLVYTFPNADIDGDQLPVKICMTERSRDLAEEAHPSLLIIANGVRPNEQFNKAGIPKHTSLRFAEAIRLEAKGEIPDSAFDKVIEHSEIYGRNYRKAVDSKYRHYTHGKFGRENEYYFDRTTDADKHEFSLIPDPPYYVEPNRARLKEKFKTLADNVRAKIEEKSNVE